MTDHKSDNDNDNEKTPPSEKDSLRSSSSNRQIGVATYVICIPEGSKTPKLKYGSIRKIDIEDEAHQIIKHIEDIESQTVEMVSHVNNININCSSCCLTFSTCFKARDVNAKGELKVNTGISVDANINNKKM